MRSPILVSGLLLTGAVSLLAQRVVISPPPSPVPLARDVPTDPAAVGYLNLHKRHPDAREGRDEFDIEYQTGPALERLDQMRGFLESFAKLTDLARGRLSTTEVASVGNTEWDMQELGFHNIPLIFEGTLLQRDYLLRQAQYELAQLRRSRGQATDQDVAVARAAYADATKKFQVFWDTKLPSD